MYPAQANPLSRALGITNAERTPKLKREVARALDHPISFVAENPNGEIIGIALNSIQHRNEQADKPEHPNDVNTPKMRELTRITDAMYKEIWNQVSKIETREGYTQSSYLVSRYPIQGATNSQYADERRANLCQTGLLQKQSWHRADSNDDQVSGNIET